MKILRTRVPLAFSALLVTACGGGGSGGTPSFEYVTPTPVYTACTAIADNAPDIGSLLPLSFTVTPALPQGLTLDAVTGVISGIPEEVVPGVEYTVVAATAGGIAEATVTITVNTVALSFEYGTANVLALARAVPLTALPEITSGTAASFALSAGTLPTGYTLDAVTGAIEGAVAIDQATTVTITATDCIGNDVDVDVDIDVGDPKARGVWIANGSSDSISTYLRDATDGGLVTRGVTTSSGGDNRRIAVHPSGRFVYASASAGQDLELYTADPATGELNQSGAPTDVGSAVITAVAIDPSGMYLYATTDPDLVHGFEIDSNDGSLTSIAAPLVALSEPRALAIAPNGAFLYVGFDAGAAIDVYDVDSLDGTLSFATSIGVPAGVESLVLHPDVGVLYAAGSAGTDIYGYAVDFVTGGINPAVWSPFAVGHAGMTQLAVADDAIGLFAISGTIIDQFGLDSNGMPLAQTPPTVALTDTALHVAIDPSSRNLYVTQSDGTVFVQEIDAVTGELFDAPQPIFSVHSGARFLAFQPSHAAPEFVTTGFFALDLDESEVFAFEFDADGGTLTAATGADTGTNSVWSIAMHPTRDFLYVSNDNTPANEGSLLAWSVDAGQDLTSIGSFGVDLSLDGIAFDPSGRFLYHSLYGDSEVRLFLVDRTDGELAAGATASVGDQPGASAVHPNGGWLAVPNGADDTVGFYSIDSTTGVLTHADTEPTANPSPAEVRFHSSGRFAYVGTLATGQIEGFDVTAPGTGVTSINDTTVEVGLPRSFALAPHGGYLVAASGTTNALGVWFVDQDRGNVTPDGTVTFHAATVLAGMAPLYTVNFDSSGQWLLVTDEEGRVQVRPFDSSTGAIGGAVATTQPGSRLHRAALRTIVR